MSQKTQEVQLDRAYGQLSRLQHFQSKLNILELKLRWLEDDVFIYKVNSNMQDHGIKSIENQKKNENAAPKPMENHIKMANLIENTEKVINMDTN